MSVKLTTAVRAQPYTTAKRVYTAPIYTPPVFASPASSSQPASLHQQMHYAHMLPATPPISMFLGAFSISNKICLANHNHFGNGKIEMDNALSATSILRKRYVSAPFDVFSLGSSLSQSRFGSFVSRVYDAYLKYGSKGKLGETKKWDFETSKMAERPVSDYCEKNELITDLIPWVQIAALCFDWSVDERGNLKVVKISGYVSFNAFYLN